MGKLIVIVVIVFVIVWLLKRAIAGSGPGARAAPAPGALQGDLVSCSHCGVNLPKEEARAAGNEFYCGEEHARLGPRSR